MKLLLGDDHPIFGALMAQHFRNQGHTVVQEVTDPGTALAMRDWIGCDACVVGLGVTPLSELSSSLGRRRSSASPAVVLLLRVDTSAVVEGARQSGVDGIGTKDDDFEAIHALVREAVRRRRAGLARAALSTSARAALPSRQAETGLLSITPRERQILQLLAAGKDTAGMATTLGVRVTTVRTHVASLMRKLGAHTRLETMAIARRLHLLDPCQPLDESRPAHQGTLVDTGRGSA